MAHRSRVARWGVWVAALVAAYTLDLVEMLLSVRDRGSEDG